MLRAIFKNTSPFLKILFSVSLCFVLFLIFLFIGIGIASLFFDLNFFDAALQENANNIENLRLMKFMQIIQSLGLFVVPPFLLAYVFSDSISRYLKLEQTPSLQSYFFTILIMIIALPVINFMVELNSHLDLPVWLEGIEKWMIESEQELKKISEVFLKAETTTQLLVNLFIIAVLPAIGEELLFRGILQRLFAEWTKNIHWGIFISAFLFSAFHLQFFGFLPRLALGMLFGYLLFWSGSLWIPILAHFVNNAFAVIAYYFYSQNITEINPDQLGTSQDMPFLTLGSALFITFLLYRFYQDNKTTPQQHINQK